jgi:zinc protease
MAHFLEHMAFNGSENFAAGTLIEWFQAHGMAFGADTNAHTAFSETVYKLDLPENDVETLREGLTVLKDFAFGMTIADAEVDAEKGVIDGEERERDSAGFRSYRRQLDELYAGTLLPTRLPIGTKEARDAFTGASVRAFYERWYRPELMTLVIVGDLGELDPTALITEFFGDVAAPAEAIQPEPEMGTPEVFVDGGPGEQIIAIYDEELPTVQISIARVKPYVDRADTVAQRQEDLKRALAHGMVNLRFAEMRKDPETPFLNAGSGQAGGMQVFEGGDLTVSADPEKWDAAMHVAWVEMRKALNFGFHQAELDEVRADALRALDEAVEREATAHSAGLREGLLGVIENGGVPTDAATRRDILRPALEALTVEDCVDALRNQWRGGKLQITAVGSLDLGEEAAAKLKAVYVAASDEVITASAEVAAAKFAYASDAAAAGEVVAQKHVEDELDFWTVAYANGVRLNVKKTDFKDRQVLVSARVGEGAMTVANDELIAGSLGSGFYTAGGLEAHDSDELRRITAGKQVGVGLALNDDHISLGGGTAPDDLLLQLELMCAFLEHPGWRPDGLVQFRQQIPLIFQMLPRQPTGPLMMDFLPEFYSDNLRVGLFGMTILPSQAELEAIDMAAIRAALEPQLGDAPIELTIVGDVDVNQVIALVARTVGALPQRRAAAHRSRMR